MATVNKDFRVKHGLIVEGTNGTINGSDIITEDAIVGGTQTNITVTYNPTTKVVDFVAENGIDSSTTDNLTEGTTNLYFTNERAQDAVGNNLGSGLTYDDPSGTLGVQRAQMTTLIVEGASGQSYGLVGTAQYLQAYNTNGYNAEIDVNIAALESKLDTDGYAKQTDISTHADLTSTHGVTGNIVGTTDSQDLSNKRIVDTLYFTDGVTVSNEGEIVVRAVTHDFDVKANYGNLNLETIAAGSDVNIISQTGDIVLNASGESYIGSASAGNIIATHTYVDTAISGLNWKESAHLFERVSNIPLTGLTGTVIIDGHPALTSAENGYRLLLDGQTTATEKGIYVYSDDGTNYTLTRSTDADLVAELDGAAIFIMEGTVYGTTSWVQTNHYMDTFDDLVWTQFSGTGAVTAGNGIIINGVEVSIDTDIVATHTYVTGAIDALTTNVIEEGTTNLYYTTSRAKTDAAALLTGATLSNITITGDGAGLTITAENGVADSTTNDLAEGTTNLYYTNQRVKDVLTGSTQTNISITDVGGVLTITAENGVADSTTNDLDEGTTNLYFTNARAVDALEAVTPNFPAIEINNVVKQVSNSIIVTSSDTPEAVLTFAKASYRSAKIFVKTAHGSHTEVSEILLTLDTSDNVAITEYAEVATNGSLADITADISGADVRIMADVNNNLSTVSIYATLLP